jgi:hypothetical protein
VHARARALRVEISAIRGRILNATGLEWTDFDLEPSVRGRAPFNLHRFLTTLVVLALPSCATRPADTRVADTPRAVFFVSKTYCQGATSCVVGRVTRSGYSLPVSGAVIFIEPVPFDHASQSIEAVLEGRANHAQSARTLVTRTDVDAYFSFQGLAPGRYMIEVYGLGERERGQYNGTFEIADSGVVFVDIRLASLRR